LSVFAIEQFTLKFPCWRFDSRRLATTFSFLATIAVVFLLPKEMSRLLIFTSP